MKLYTKIVGLLFLVMMITACKQSEKNTANPSTSNSENRDVIYTSKMTKADKKKYYNANNNVVFEVKYKSDGFKLRTASSKLLWKIKLYDNKIKISDNEENLNPYEIKLINSSEAKLVKEDTKLARLTYDVASKTQTITTTHETKSKEIKGKYSPSLLVNNISEIPDDQKKIIMDELVLKGF
ncbi:hypothetical protein [Aquimarina sp. 2201CG5-10]|uniref:hypothetical protein n=1 Tax=Aquimarina callyspongiae TaxID=3098150 RepID=UPI002AB5991B|nr:hypothetical protein [Aquimarina sp. 2201CG5-10]MDY8136032.1 hypothetical protein [Aquimarina sp. 2201CG5-10]